MKGHERILQLHSLLSKLMDSLCFELTVNRIDENCLSLLEILQWKKQGDIDYEEFLELYKSWLQSKSVFDVFTCRQIECYPKEQLISNELVQNSLMNVGQITKALELLNEAYNKFYIEKKPKNQHLIEKVQRIFSYLDSPGYIHIRSSSLFFFAGALSVAQNYSIPINYQAFKVYLTDVKKDLCEINGMVALRNFKNYFLGSNSPKKLDLLQKVMPILFQIQKKTTGNGGLPNIMDEAFNKWKFFPRFNSHDGKKNIEIYKRVFEENQFVFFDDRANIDFFTEKYGEEFLRCFHIDSGILREFATIMREILNKNVDLFSKISVKSKQNNAPTHRRKQHSDLSQTKLTPKASGRDKTPTKGFKKNDFLKGNRTPTKSTHQQFIRKQFGSAQKSKSKTYNARNTTPTKSYRPVTSNLYQSQANTNQKVAIKNGIQKDSFYNKMVFFKNKRVESYEIVIKRLKGK